MNFVDSSQTNNEPLQLDAPGVRQRLAKLLAAGRVAPEELSTSSVEGEEV